MYYHLFYGTIKNEQKKNKNKNIYVYILLLRALKAQILVWKTVRP